MGSYSTRGGDHRKDLAADQPVPRQHAQRLRQHLRVKVERTSVRPDRERLIALARLADAGKLMVHVAETFPRGQAAGAHAFQAAKPIGKVVLTL